MKHSIASTVRLISGGPTMVVSEGARDQNPGTLRCIWFDPHQTLQSADFPAMALRDVTTACESLSITARPEIPSFYSNRTTRLLLDAIDIYRTQNPSASLDNTNQFAKDNLVPILDAIPTADVLESGVADLPYIRDRLNPQERELLNENLSVGLYAMNHAASALDMTVYYYGTNRANDNSDAYRHAYWNALMGSDGNVGPIWAKRWGDAHEEGASNNPPREKEMDLFNNEVGLSMRNRDDFVLAQNVKDAVNRGRMRRIVQSNGPLVSTDSSGSIR